IFHVARQPIERLDDDDREAAFARIGHQRGQPVAAQHRAAGARRVVIARHDLDPLAGGETFAERDLIGDRALRLQLGREAGIDGGAGHYGFGSRCGTSLAWLAALRTSSLSFSVGARCGTSLRTSSLLYAAS